jgi:FMN-dependent oxidoreductase (nitrilotriacetate monooxygenase family)
MTDMFHMGWFLSFNAAAWRSQWSGRIATEFSHPELYIDMAQALERAGFDYMMLEDGSFIPDVYEGSMRQSLASGSLPKHDPMALIPLIGRATSRIGVVATTTTTFYPPFLAARLMQTLDHLTNGRIGLNLVTSHNIRTAQNYGLDEQIEHDTRYAMADEWVACVKALWDTWEPNAVVMNDDGGVFVDHTKVHHANFSGRWYSSRGPLNCLPGPQGHPVICQAGGSSAGRAFGARNADTIVASVSSVPAMKKYREEVDALMLEAGRKPSDCKVLFVISPVLGETQAEAEAKRERLQGTEAARIERGLITLSFTTGVDFSKFDLDGPIPELMVNGARSTTERILNRPGAITLRDALAGPPPIVDIVGTPDAVAATMGEYMEEVGGDGYLISGTVNRRYIAEIADGLSPALRRRGLIRDGYSHEHLRDNLMAF